jgi:hypothetical protein
MINRDPKCIFVAADVAEATVVANWLEHEGVPAQVMDTMTLGGLDGLTAWTGVSARGIEVWALREDLVDRARELLAEHKDIQSTILAQKIAKGRVSVQCEECGCASVFPADCRGTTDVCPRCGCYLDVPEEGGDEPPCAATEGTNNLGPASARSIRQSPSWWQVIQKAIIYAAAFCLISMLCLPVIAVLMEIVSRWWTR